MSRFFYFAMLFVFGGFLLSGNVLAQDLVPYVSDGGGGWGNWDIYLLNVTTGATSRLTTDPAIDNHPDLSPDGNWVVFSSNRTGEFDLYLGDVSDVEGTIRQLTTDAHLGDPTQTSYPDRHCHFHPNGRAIVFSSKNLALDHPIEIASECSVPIIITPPRFYERINVMTLKADGTEDEYKELDIRDAWDSASFPGIWRSDTATYTGHPSFNPDGTKIVFSGSIDGEGKEWEVYTVDIEIVSMSLTGGSLRRVTNGPAVGPNPIKMSGGAHFNADGSSILFSSTRTYNGNSQIYSVPANGVDIPLTSATQLTIHAGNDYIPHPLSDSSFLVVSDLGSPALCGQGEGPTADLDIVRVNTTRQVIGVEANQETLLLADEVSWFCGLPPNLGACRSVPRIMNSEALWLERSAHLFSSGAADSTLIPDDLLSGFGYPTGAIGIYSTGFQNMDGFMSQNAAGPWNNALNDLQMLDGSNFPGLDDQILLQEWMHTHENVRQNKHVVSSIMYEDGISPPPAVGIYPSDNNVTAGDQLTVNLRINRSLSSSTPFTPFVVARGPYGLLSFTFGGGRWAFDRGLKNATGSLSQLPGIEVPPPLNNLTIPQGITGDSSFIATLIPAGTAITSEEAARNASLSWSEGTVRVQ